jgi:hypothetical protein
MRTSINNSKLRARIANAALTLLVITPLCAAETGTPESPYAPYAFLIGEWDVTPEAGGPTTAVVSYRWGPNQSYIFNSVSELRNGVPTPHLEGIMVYNPITRKLETLVEIDLIKGQVLEKGSFTLQHEGHVVREVSVYPPRGAKMGQGALVSKDGVIGPFREGFQLVNPDLLLTQIMHKSKTGWEPNFPGSDHLAMRRRAPH